MVVSDICNGSDVRSLSILVVAFRFHFFFSHHQINSGIIVNLQMPRSNNSHCSPRAQYLKNEQLISLSACANAPCITAGLNNAIQQLSALLKMTEEEFLTFTDFESSSDASCSVNFSDCTSASSVSSLTGVNFSDCSDTDPT